MPGYHCDYCDRTVARATAKLIAAHNRGQQHRLMRKAFYAELREEASVVAELESIRRMQQRGTD
ncbi:hypothetical protein PAPHI01_0149 [Pancytospora philotis]|nr:hypothetical protein PAPHI01_0149 [Pancytospora philotis]